jgi:Domain of unknown function (DUF4747)
MARESFIPIGALNIAMHAPHSPARYVELFRRLYSMKKIVNARGVNGALIGNLYPLRKGQPEDGLTGEFYQFIQLDAEEPWFDLLSKNEASDDDRQAIVIPDNLKPHLARFSFIFFPKGHRLYIQLKNKNRSFGIQTASIVMKGLLADQSLEVYGPIEVTVEPEVDSVASIFKIPYIHELKIELVRPNPDDHQDAERELLERLEKQQAKKMTVSLTSSRSESLKPDEDTKILAKVAASNGYVYASGRDSSDQPIVRSTREMPWIEHAVYDSNLQSANEVLYQTAAQMHKQIT